MKEKRGWTRWIYWFTFAVAVIFIYKILDNFSDITNWFKNLISIVMPFLTAIFISYILYIPCKKIEKEYSKTKILRKRARGLSVITVYIIAILIIALAINTILPAVSKSLSDLANSLPAYYRRTINIIEDIPQNSVIKKESIENLIHGLEQIDIVKLVSLENVSTYIKGALGVASGILSGFVTIIMSVYILLERGEILKFIKRLNKAIFKEEACKAIDSYFMKANEIFFKFISSQILDAIIIGIIMSVALWIMGVKYWILLGFMIGLFNLIPYFGAIISVFIAALITLFTGGIGKAIWMLIVVIVLQQIDANIINPKILKNALKLSPILVIFSVAVFGAYFGVIGMFLAVPIIAVIKIFVNDYINYKISKKENIGE